MGDFDFGRANRRVVLTGGLAWLTFACRPACAAGRGLRISPDRVIARVPEDYTGFSVEKAQLSDPAYFDASNTGLVALCKRLSPHGILRIGGNSSEFCYWNPEGRAAPKVKAYGIGQADNWMPQSFTPVSPGAVDALKRFLDACGWRCIWGFNLGTATPEENAAEAAYAARVLGTRVKYFQIGNEPDFYAGPNNRLRPAGWDFDDYLKEWQAHVRAIQKVVPDAKFGGPDVGASPDWVIRFARAARPLLGAQLVALTGHYYASGPPDAKWVGIPALLKSNDAAARRMAAIRPVADGLGLGYRMSEGNSCYRGGKAGMSDTFASALWGGDYMLAMAAAGCQGINFHCGSGAMIAHSLGGKLPGARNRADMARAKLGAFYAPVAGSLKAGFDARPLYYGMMLAQQFAGSSMLALSADFGGVNASAYAAMKDGNLQVAVFNKSLDTDLTVPLSVDGKPYNFMATYALTGPAPDAMDGVKFAGSAVAHQTAKWAVGKIVATGAVNGQLRLVVPRASAILATIAAF